MVNLVTLTPDSGDFPMDEQSSVTVTVNVVDPNGTPRDITGATVVWKAFLNGVQQIKKDTATMMVMLAPQTASTVSSAGAPAGQDGVPLTAVAGFGADGWGRPILDFAAGDIITLLNASGANEYGTIESIDPTSKILTMTSPLVNTYGPASAVAKIVSQFIFSLLPGDTILPATKSYGTNIIYQHLAQIMFPAPLTPGNIYQAQTTLVGVRGRIFIAPIPDMS